jgi:hypothetical protein
VNLGDSRKSECPYIRESTKWRALQVVIAMVTIFIQFKNSPAVNIRCARRRLGLALAADRRYEAFTFCAVQYFSLWQHAVIIIWTAEGIFSGAGHASKIATSMKRVITFCCA